MSDAIEGKKGQTPSTELEGRRVSDGPDWQYGYGPYRFCSPAQDQLHVEGEWGAVSGIRKRGGDIQSDGIDAPSYGASRAFSLSDIVALMQQFGRSNRGGCWDERTAAGMVLAESAAVERPLHGRDSETNADDISLWAPAVLAAEILQADAQSDLPRLRKMILLAEDTSFTVNDSSRLAPWFLNFAKRYRDSTDPHDEAVVLAAIRTGASMLAPDDADSLHPLLQPGHSVETSLVTVKMLGRIFEAQPPMDVDRHTDLAEEVAQIAESLLNRYAITVSQSAAMTHLAIYALAAMASSETCRVVSIARDLGAAWFVRRLRRKLCELREVWANRTAVVPDAPRALLNRAIDVLGAD